MSTPDLGELFSGLEVHLDPAPADWIVQSLEPWGGAGGFTVASLVPPHYDGYVRIFHPAGEHRWADIAAAAGRHLHPAMQFTKLIPGPDAPHGYRHDLPHPRQGTLEPRVRAPLLELLVQHTATPASGWFCVWNGFGRLPREVAERYGVVRAQARTYLLLSGPVAAVDRFGSGLLDGPQIWWPADRAWCVASEIDLDSTIVAGHRRLTDEILRSPDLESLPVDRRTRLDHLGDEINPATMSDEELERLRQQL